MKTKPPFDLPEDDPAPMTARVTTESRRARRPMPSYNRIDSCPRCGYPTLAWKGRTLCCEVRTSEIHEEIRTKERRCRKRKEKTELSRAETEGGAECPSLDVPAGQLALFETGE